MRKKPYVRVIGITFLALYLLAMVVATELTKERFENENSRNLDAVLDIVSSDLRWYGERYLYDTKDLEDSHKNYIQGIASDIGVFLDDEEFQKFSVAIYETNGEKIAQTSSVLRIQEHCYDINTLFSDEEIEFIRQVFRDTVANESYETLDEKHVVWYVQAYVNEETGELAKLCFSSDNRRDFIDYEHVESEFIWVNPEEEVHNHLKKEGEFPHVGFYINIPYFRQGESEYDAWLNNEYLQEFPAFSDVNNDAGGWHEIIGIEHRGEYNYQMIVQDKEWTVKIRYVAMPVLQAMNHLRYLYIVSAIFVAVCVWIVIRSLNKFYNQREKLEITRRDFTNAIAHELKTPLGIIRGFAENSLENTNETKREYYLKQIVGQTEEMDKLVKEMVYISKLDSEGMSLKKEPVHLETLVRSQLEKLAPLSDEKNLNIRVDVKDNVVLQGDQAYLERAIWNVLHNAIEYNHLDGFVRITINKKEMRIENSGVRIKEDELPHVFDMFYTSDKSRNFSEKHMGLGLYLTKKILELHKMNIKIGNTDTGVEVVINM